ncbi:MAG: hypothetical protein KAR35_00430 [Candidatus Heimdallarchaeota archaeon]|nr:hypothetical protein [Candidatus Heimdallarchaeota archaeon]MCK5047817.1 hypothetical protein [Candidatus Heimdallarchaeota archaeon]
MNRKIVLLTFVSILLFSFIPNDTSAQTMVNPFEQYDMMYWNLDSNMYTLETETMTEANQYNSSEIYHISENFMNGNFVAFGYMDMLVNNVGTEFIGGEYLNFIDIIGQGYQDLDPGLSSEYIEHNEWDVLMGWNNWSDTFDPKFKPDMESFSDHLFMNETYIPLGIPDQPDYHNGAGPGPFGFLDEVMLDFEMNYLGVSPGNAGYNTNINGMPYTLTVTYVEASYYASHSGVYGFQWGPYWFDVSIDMDINLTYELIYDEATGMMISHNQYVDRIVNAYFSGVQFDGWEDRYIEFSYTQVSGEYIHLNLNGITTPSLYDGERFVSITDGPAVVGDFFTTDGYHSSGQYSDMVLTITDTATDQLLHEDNRGNYWYSDADINTLMTIFFISEIDLGVIHDAAVADLGGTAGWYEYNYDVNQGGVIRDDSNDDVFYGMGTFYEIGFDIVPYESSHIPMFYYPDSLVFDKWEFMQGGDMWVDPFGGVDEIVIDKTTTTSTMMKTYDINGFTFDLLVENQNITYEQSFTTSQLIPLGDEGDNPLWVEVDIYTDILVQFSLYYDTETGMIVEMVEYSKLYFNVFADVTLTPPTSPTLDLQTATIDIYIDMNSESYKEYGWEIISSSFMYLEEQVVDPIDDPTDNDTNPTNDSESTLSPVPVLELAFIAPVGMIIAIVRRRK